jgi:hypothetical protein
MQHRQLAGAFDCYARAVHTILAQRKSLASSLTESQAFDRGRSTVCKVSNDDLCKVSNDDLCKVSNDDLCKVSNDDLCKVSNDDLCKLSNDDLCKVSNDDLCTSHAAAAAASALHSLLKIRHRSVGVHMSVTA